MNNLDRTTVTMSDDTKSVNLHLTNKATLRAVALILKDVIQPGHLHDAGALMVDFIRNTNKGVSAYLLGDPNEIKLPQNYISVVMRRGVVRLTVSVHPHVTTAFTGDLKEFLEFTDPNKTENTYVGKVVKFIYNGGTEYGTRIVKVESVRKTNAGVMMLAGKDVHKDEYRQYSVEKISNLTIVG